MARSKAIDDAVRELLIIKHGNTTGFMDSCTHLVTTITNEIKNSFSPFSDAEIPFLIFSLQSICSVLRERYPESAKIADVLSVAFSCIAVVESTGKRGESDV